MTSIDLTTASLTDLQAEGQNLIQQWAELEESRTQILRRLADVVVSIRQGFLTEDSRPDWRGSSWEYRQFIGEMYEASGVPPDSASNIQAALRYHVGNRLREVVPAEELEEAGLLASSPKDRMMSARQEMQALAVAMSEDLQSGDLATRRERYGRLSEAAVALSDKMASFEVDELPKRQAQKVLEQIREAEGNLQALAESLRRRVE